MPKTAVSTRPKGWTAPPLVEPGEGDQVVSYSELDTYRQCPLKWVLSYKERWSKTPDEDSPLTKGSLWHEVMEAHYLAIQAMQRGKPQDEALDDLAAKLSRLLWDGPNQSANQKLIWWMYQGYLEKYGYDPDWEVLGVEVKFQARLVGPNGPSPYIVKGKLDLVVRHRKTGKIWIIDHKSGANLPSLMDLDVDDQFGLYAWLLREAGIDVLGVIHNAARTTMNVGDDPDNWDPETGEPLKKGIKRQTLDQRMHRTLMNRGKRELDGIGRDAWAVASNAYPELSGLDSLPLYSSPDPRQCGWKCDFLEAHLVARKGRPIRSALEEFGFVQRFERH
ncbi:Cas4 family exonuclease [Microbacterium phage Milani]|nr:Cas4 family exonuclease [Microbacterium phage Milani]